MAAEGRSSETLEAEVEDSLEEKMGLGKVDARWKWSLEGILLRAFGIFSFWRFWDLVTLYYTLVCVVLYLY